MNWSRYDTRMNLGLALDVTYMKEVIKNDRILGIPENEYEDDENTHSIGTTSKLFVDRKFLVFFVV